MGIGIVLLMGAVAGLFVAAIASAYLQHKMEALSRGTGTRRAELLRTAAVLPFGCLVWAGLVFVVQAVVNTTWFGRDVGIGDWFQCPLPNGYSLQFVDTTEIGMLCRTLGPAHHECVGSVDNVRLLQLAGGYLLGATDSNAITHFGRKDNVDAYFMLDARNDAVEIYYTHDDLVSAALARNIRVKLEPIGEFYSRYRWGWFDLLALVLIMAPPLAGYRWLTGRAAALTSAA